MISEANFAMLVVALRLCRRILLKYKVVVSATSLILYILHYLYFMMIYFKQGTHF